MAVNEADLGSLASDARWQAPALRPGSAVWTDDYSDLAPYLLFTQRRRMTATIIPVETKLFKPLYPRPMPLYDTFLLNIPLRRSDRENRRTPSLSLRREPRAPPMTVRQRPWSQFPEWGVIALIAPYHRVRDGTGSCSCRRARLDHPGRPRALLRAKRPAAARRELLFVSRRQEAKRGPAARLAGGDSQRGRVGAGRRGRQARREPDRRGDQLRRARDAPQRQARRREKVAVLTRWVSLGAPWPERDRAAHAPSSTRPSPRRPKLPALDRSLWSLQPVRRSVVPDGRS